MHGLFFDDRRLLRASLVVGIFSLLAWSAHAELVFTGYLVDGNRPMFGITSDKASGWVSVGQRFDGFLIRGFDPVAKVLNVEKDGQRRELRMASGVIANAKRAAGDDQRAKLRSLKGLELAYELASEGDRMMAQVLQRHQQALLAAGGDPNDRAVKFLKAQATQMAEDRAAKILASDDAHR